MRLTFLLFLLSVIFSFSVSHLEARDAWGQQRAKPSNAGTDFYATLLPVYRENVTATDKYFFYIASSDSGTAVFEIPSKSISKTIHFGSYTNTPVSFNPEEVLVYMDPYSFGAPPEKIYKGAAVHITTTVPVSICVAQRSSSNCDTYTLLPVESLGKKYIISASEDVSSFYGGSGSNDVPSQALIVATSDSTKVTFTLGGPANNHTSGGLSFGQTTSFMMNRGDVWTVANDVASQKDGDLSGSLVVADKPIAIFNGNACGNVPATTTWCDLLLEQLQPMEHWGKHYLIPVYLLRSNGYFHKVFASTPGQTLKYDGKTWKTLSSIGGGAGQGWLYMRVDGSGNNTVCLSSDMPLSDVVYNPGITDDGTDSDPFEMSVIPWEQFSTSYFFSTPAVDAGALIERKYLGVVFPLTDAKTIPDDLEVGVVKNGVLEWTKYSAKFGKSFNTKYTYKEIMPNGKVYGYKEVQITSEGICALRCSQPIGAYFYGGSDVDGYGHPVGSLQVNPLTSVDKEAPQSVVERIGRTFKITSTDLPNNAAIRSGLSKITLADSAVNVLVRDINSNVANKVSHVWTVEALDSTKAFFAHFTISDMAGNDSSLYIAASGTTPGKTPQILGQPMLQYCVGDTATYTASALPGASFEWYNGQHGSTLRLSSPVAGDISIWVIVRYLPDTTSYRSTVQNVHFTDNPQKPKIAQNLSGFNIEMVIDSYQWYVNGVPINGATNPYYFANIDTVKSIFVIAMNDAHCSTSSDTLRNPKTDIHIDLSDDIPYLTDNPTATGTTLFYGAETPVSVDIVNSAGIQVGTVISASLGRESSYIPLKNYSPGLYTLVLHYPKSTKYIKVLRIP